MCDDEEGYDMCTVCYENKEDVQSSCPTCKIDLCLSCWYLKCKSFCPICERSKLNSTRYACNVCYNVHHLKDLDICSACDKWVCKECNEQEYHCCETMATRTHELFELHDCIAVFLLYYKHKFRCNDFYVLGKITFDFGTVVFVKDVDAANREVVLVVWDSTTDPKIFHKVCKETKMHVYRLGNLARGVKTYSPSATSSFQHMNGLVTKMKKIRVCGTCRKDLGVCATGLCMSCITKRRLFYRWMRSRDVVESERNPRRLIKEFIDENNETC